jgi:hypothetical protein
MSGMRIDGQYVPTSTPPPEPTPSTASGPVAPHAPPKAAAQRPTPASIHKKVEDARKLQASADRAVRSAEKSENLRFIQRAQQLKQAAKEAWDEVERDVRASYEHPAKAPKSQGPVIGTGPAPWNPASIFIIDAASSTKGENAIHQVAHIEANTAELLRAGSTDPRFQKIVMNAQADAAAQVPADPNAAYSRRARELEWVGRAAASDTPLATLDALENSSNAYFTRDEQQALQAQVLCGGNAALAAAYVHGGVTEATHALRRQIEQAGSPEAAATLAAGSRALLTEAGLTLGRDSHLADGTRESGFDATVSDLAAIDQAMQTAEPGSTDAAQRLLTQVVTQNIDKRDIGAFDEALARAAIRDGYAALTTDVIAALKQSGNAGKARQADAILNRTNEEFDAVAKDARKAQDQLIQLQTEAQDYVAKSAPLADEAGIQAALAQFWSDPQRTQIRQDAETALVKSLDAAEVLSKITNGPGAGLGHADDASRRIDKFTTDPGIVQGIASSEVAKAFIAQRQFASSAGQPGLFSPSQLARAITAAGGQDKVEQARNAWFAIIRDAALGQAISLKAGGDGKGSVDAVDGLARYKQVFAAGDANYDLAVDGLKRAAGARNADEAESALAFWGSEANSASNAPGKLAIGERFSATSAAALSVAGTTIDIAEFVARPGVAQAWTTGLNGAQTLVNVLTAVKSFDPAALPKISTTSLGVAGKWINGIGAFVSTVDLLGDHSGNWTLKGLKVANAVGSWMVLASGTTGLVGAGVVLLASAAIYQYGRVSSSNRYETPAATQFIHTATGLNDQGDEPVAYQLRNDDSNGRNHNEVIYRAVAQHLGIAADFSPESKRQVVAFLNQLSSDQAGSLADTAAHVGYRSVDPGTDADAVDANGQVYAQTTKDDDLQRADAELPNDLAGPIRPLPGSVNGLALWIDRELA